MYFTDDPAPMARFRPDWLQSPDRRAQPHRIAGHHGGPQAKSGTASPHGPKKAWLGSFAPNCGERTILVGTYLSFPSIRCVSPLHLTPLSPSSTQAMRNVMRKGIQIGELDSFIKKAPENAESTEASALIEAEPTQAGIERQVPAAEITGIVTCAARRNMVFGRLFAMGLRQSLAVPIEVIGVNREAPPKMTDQAAEPLQAPPIQETMEQANESRPETAELFQVMASLSSDPAMTGRADWEAPAPQDLTTEQETVEQANEPMILRSRSRQMSQCRRSAGAQLQDGGLPIIATP
ncbi:hypothetical protein AK812_SmicGene12592 [Symbiodinium microadriaticum]|uniref:Uncharacterized protein n=1 Tax=Symbiodinium microadriaticum TaxID=2951 RepID=A0A1Q9EA73_SYMMI|nr:hypothetical protein AK812_SmicGene12592 [Symbiodinium microadriaticum]